MSIGASLILLNGKVWTGNPAQPWAEAVAVQDGIIHAVGSTREIRKLASKQTQIFDLNSRLLVPGFNDAHVHFLMGGATLVGVQLAGAESPEALCQRIAQFARTQPAGTWLRDGNWDHQRWTPATLPSRTLIDAACGGHPTLLWRHDRHMALANSLAFKLAGIDRHTANVPGGEIERDATGEPTGILKDAAVALVDRVTPPLSAHEQQQSLLAAMREAARNGVTSVQNMADSSTDALQASLLRTLQELERAGQLTVRLYTSLPLRDWRSLAACGLTAPFGTPTLRVGNLKAFSDGSLGAATAWMEAPFTNRPDSQGLASPDLLDLEGFYESLCNADRAGLQLSIHAIGDRANRTLLDLFARMRTAQGPARRRLRIEHAQHLHADDCDRFADLGVIASMQPYHAVDDGRWAELAIGQDRAQMTFAWRSLLDAGARLAFGSDWPVAPMNPIAGIHAAVTRATLDGRNPGGWIPRQRISVEEALTAYTSNAAFAEHQEQIKGRIEPGMLADLAVLSADLFTIEPEQITTTQVDLTVFGGRIVYERK